MADIKTQWKKGGELSTKPDGVLTPVDGKVQQIYVVVGFGVNTPAAYRDGVSYINIDPGHAFLYTVRENKVTRFFSFGPRIHGEFLNATATPDYGMDYATRLFKVPVSAEQMSNVEATIDKYRQQVLDGSMLYRGITNDTCAETARQILTESGVSTPSGTGPVSVETKLHVLPNLSDGKLPQFKTNTSSLTIPSVSIGPLKTTAQKFDYAYPTLEGGRLPDVSVQDLPISAPKVISAVTPYKWHDSFRISNKYKEAILSSRGDKWLGVFTNADPAASNW
jgi:hypothetical protein